MQKTKILEVKWFIYCLKVSTLTDKILQIEKEQVMGSRYQ